MTPKKTTPATKEFCVYATQVVYQNVQAVSGQEAYRIAKESPDSFEPCGSSLTLDRAVKDVETDEFVLVGEAGSHCKSCGSEIVVAINDSNFNEDECGPCECHRYKLVPNLLAAIEEAKNYVENMLASSGCDDGEGEMIDRWQKLLREANGQAA